MGNQIYTLSQLETTITQVLAGQPNSGCPAIQTVNRAITMVANWYDWSWRSKPFTLNINQNNLASPGGLSVWVFDPTTNANVTGSAAWATAGYPPIYRDNIGIVWVYYPNHGLAPGSYFGITGVTPSSGDNFPFNSTGSVFTTPDLNTFTYQIPGQLQNGATQDITVPQTPSPQPAYGYWVAGDYQLPLDFAGWKTLRAYPGSWRNVWPTDIDRIYFMRQVNFGTTYEVYYSVGYMPQATTAVEPTPTMFLFPIPALVAPAYLEGQYRRRIPALVNPGDVPDVPSHMQDLVFHACRALAVSAEFDRANTDWQLTMQFLQRFSEEDGSIQQPLAYMKNTVRLGYGTLPVNPSFYPMGNITSGGSN